MIARSYLQLLPLAATLTSALPFAANATCPVVLDGRVPANASLSDFDSAATSPGYDPSYVFGAGLKWSEILQFPDITPSYSDVDAGTKPFEVTINDSSIFQGQTGFRRAELLPAGGDAIVTGKKTLQFSLMIDPQRPLNYSHEYQLVFVETADYSTNQVVLKTGTLIGGTGASKRLLLQGNVASSPPATLFETPFEEGQFYNFGLVMDFDANTIEVFYSTGNNTLLSQGSPVSNDLSGKGQWHVGVLKKPTGNVQDVTKQGYQESGIDEGIIYGGVFFEDNSSDCYGLASVKPTPYV